MRCELEELIRARSPTTHNHNHMITLKSPAKLNLYLRILNRRSDGYHNIQTVFQLINWHDTLSFELRSDSKINVYTDTPDLPESDNLVFKAAQALRQATKCQQGVDITLKKTIPIGSGMGGGSSNAATTLLALNHLWNTALPQQTIQRLSASLGADVPIFTYGRNAWAEGIGDQLTAMPLPETWYLILIPPLSIKTASIFHNPRLTASATQSTIAERRWTLGHNDFENILRCDYPIIEQAMEWLGQFATPCISGSGSAMFARFATQSEANTVAAQAPTLYQTRVARGIGCSPLKDQLNQLH